MYACIKTHISNDCENWSGPSDGLDPNLEMEEQLQLVEAVLYNLPC